MKHPFSSANDPTLLYLFGGTLGLLIIASVIGWALAKRASSDAAKVTMMNLNARTRAWWGMVAVFAAALAAGNVGTTVLFGLCSFMALREFITLTPTKPGDHRTLFWVFFIITPLHYYYLATQWYGMFLILIPVYAFLFVPMRTVLAGDCERFLERTAKIQWGLMICVYCISHAPAILWLDLPALNGHNAKLLFWFVAIVEMSDVMQYVWGKTCGRRKIAPNVSPGKTWEGFIGGGLTTMALGAALWWATPFTIAQAAGMAALVVIMGFAGGLVMSAIKRDRGVKDWGGAIAGHGGFMDRLDSLAFAAPVFFHVTGYFFR
ncbi:phosphatidate cytidylyltransferase [Prosthecobacter sp.]|uniref:phosphatidate cytidylyltransferase n=1 Tax=Prosthecobacter sp. TaxID=1965333 RepID=UPI001D60F0C4|nr:phosphatidate cytidylyltransferase [Prosthecobacter sp.]MCB1277540.1 phosphatidate cytidylyltransferase [Prosthecobacter sp.]